MRRFSKVIRYTMLAIWLGCIVTAIAFYLASPNTFTPQHIAAVLSRFEGTIWIIFFAMSALRGFTLLPSTPLVIAGTLLFPLQPLSVFAVSMIGIIISSSMIYFFSEHLGFTEYFERKKPDMIHRLKAKLDHPLGMLFVAAWAFFPAVPTDLVCYAAGTTKMNYAKFIIAVIVGESILCAAYIFAGGSIINLLR